jgi:hypothetical protein
MNTGWHWEFKNDNGEKFKKYTFEGIYAEAKAYFKTKSHKDNAEKLGLEPEDLDIDAEVDLVEWANRRGAEAVAGKDPNKDPSSNGFGYGSGKIGESDDGVYEVMAPENGEWVKL